MKKRTDLLKLVFEKNGAYRHVRAEGVEILIG